MWVCVLLLPGGGWVDERGLMPGRRQEGVHMRGEQERDKTVAEEMHKGEGDGGEWEREGAWARKMPSVCQGSTQVTMHG